MKKLLMALVIVSLAFVGCVPSLNSIYTKDTVVYDPNLVGTWQDAGGAVKIVVEKGDFKSYKVTTQQGQNKTVYKAYLVKLDGMLFGDISNMENEADGIFGSLSIPGHAFFKIEATSPDLQIKNVSDDKLLEKLAAEPDMLKYTKLKGGRAVITASTAELQQFIKKNAKEDWLFGTGLTLKKAPAAAPKADEKK